MSNSQQITTILGCKNFMLREGLKHILSGTRFKVHPEDMTCSDISDLSHLLAAGPLLFVIDNNLYSDRISDAIRALKELHTGARIVVLADGFEVDQMMATLQAGADGYCLATVGCEVLVKYLDLVMLGELVFPSAMLLSALSVSDNVVDARDSVSAASARPVQITQAPEAKGSPLRTLSSREAEILQCLMQGAPNKVIARKLDVAEATVKVHIKAILRKIRVANRTQAAMWAVNHLSTINSGDTWASPG